MFVPGALFEIGGGQTAQGDGELDQTEIATSLRGKLRLTVRKGTRLPPRRAGYLTWPHGYGYIAGMTSMAAGKFKDQCLKILDQVASTGTPVVVTKRGRPVATVVPFAHTLSGTDTLAGSLLEERGDPFGTGEVWDDSHS